MKKIIVLSDGTGNSAAKRHKTNVWRLYNALNLHRPDQVAMYDDGVGSQNFLLFRLLGGVFGWGLKRNVVEMYKFLCRNYNPGENGEEPDRIYLFGFSRGAFTVRVLAGVIAECGLCRGSLMSEEELHDWAKEKFAIYRKNYKKRRNCKHCSQTCDCMCDKETTSSDSSTTTPKITFMGVWDTVDAYGLPIDELAELWDRFIYKYRFRDNRLSKQVLKACHALSIDDERQTFHPVLWDESEECVDDRIEQVWFPGVHSDVGGGYASHNLALVSLDWMISKVEVSNSNPNGLVFFDNLREEYRQRCDWNGKQHDSRAGLGAYYRYNPRDIETLCRCAGATGGKAGLPKIHRSAFERIRGTVVSYAPTGVPEQYKVVATRGAAPNFETARQKVVRSQGMKFAIDIIYWRRWLYRAFLATALLFVGLPLLDNFRMGNNCSGFLGCALYPVWTAVGGVLPNFIGPWIDAMRQNPVWPIILAVAYAVMAILKRIASGKTTGKATAAWIALKGSASPTWNPTFTSKLRAMAAGTVGKGTQKAWWLIVFLAVLSVIFIAAYWLYFHLRHCATFF